LLPVELSVAFDLHDPFGSHKSDSGNHGLL